MTLKDFIKWYLNPYFWIFPRFIVFVGESIMNEKYQDHVGGRVEVRSHYQQYSIDEWRFFTKNEKELYEFRDKYELQNLTIYKVKKLKKIIKEKFNNI